MKTGNLVLDTLFPRKMPNFRTPMSRKLVGGIYIYRRNIVPNQYKYEKTQNPRKIEDCNLTFGDENSISEKQIIVREKDEKMEQFNFTYTKEDEKTEEEFNFTCTTKKEAQNDNEDATDDQCILVEEIDNEKNIVMSGYYKKGKKFGTWWFNSQDGSALIGELDSDGKLNGLNIAYLYPDRWTALVGLFEDGLMIKAKLARVSKITRNVPEFYFVPSSAEYKYDISSHDCISSDPLLPDPYEEERVHVKQSKIMGADEGLFSKLDLGPGVIVSFYNGVRLGNDEVDARSWDENGYTMIVNEHEVLDVPPELVDTRRYCATLGHKINHSFQPNCVTELFTHPRFGRTVAVRTKQSIKKGEELTINYGYGLRINSEEMDVPDWYRRQLELFVNS
uniref:SET domain-containing protein n=1 Tax=Strigamia maritima TaxID=126957 RepID=T1J3X3_STRMM